MSEEGEGTIGVGVDRTVEVEVGRSCLVGMMVRGSVLVVGQA